MTGRFEMGMLTTVWTGSCWVAASVVAAAAGGRGAWVVEGGGSWLVVGFGLGRCRFGLCRCVCDVVGCVGWCWWWCCCWWCARLGAGLCFGVGFSFGVSFEVEEDLRPEVCGRRCQLGGFCSVLPGCLGCLCGGQGVPGSLTCGCSFDFCRRLVDEVGGKEGVGG